MIFFPERHRLTIYYEYIFFGNAKFRKNDLTENAF